MTIIKQGLLNQSRISTSIPNKTLYGPLKVGGLQLNHLYITQGLMHIVKLVRFLPSDTTTGRLLCTAMDMCIIEIGIGRNIFTMSYIKFGCLLSDSWIKHIWQFVDKHSIILLDRNSEFPLTSREGDVYLMEAFQSQG